MKEIIGIDVGGSTTKIVAFRRGEMLTPQVIRAADPLTSLYGAFGKFTTENGIELSDIKKIIMTGVGSSFSDKPIYGLPCEKASEFECVGRGGLYLSGLDEAIVASLGTGTAVVHAKKGGAITYLGGTGVGGGTLLGLSHLLLKMDSVEHISDLADEGDLGNVDLRISDMANRDRLSGMPADMTAANFGKISDLASRADISLGVLNMVFETVGMVSLFAARSRGVKDIVMTGNLTTIPYCKTVMEKLNTMFDVRFLIPDLATYGTVIGTALRG